MSSGSDVSILGCGWLGHALGQHLVERGERVRGSTTTRDKLDVLRSDDIEPYHLTLDPDISGEHVDSFFQSSILVLNVPPPRDVDDVRDFHLRQIDAVRAAARDGAVEWILFASSTSVYPTVERTVTESDVPPGKPDALPGERRRTGDVLLEAEARLMDDPDIDVTIVRFGGLYGDGRHPGRFLAGRTNLDRPKAPVNLIHQDDCVGILTAIIEHDGRNDVFNACADEHPTRQAVYTRAAEVLGLEPPTFDETDQTTGKLVDNRKVKDRFDYAFQHPDPLADLQEGSAV